MNFSLSKKITAVTLSLCIGIVSYLPMFSDENAMKKLQEIRDMLSPYFTEIVDLRGMAEINRNNQNRNELSFQMKDGSTTIYNFAEPVKFVDAQGNMKTKDISIVPQTDGALLQEGYEYANGENDYRINFSRTPGRGVRVDYGNRRYIIAPVTDSEIPGGPVKELRNEEETDAFVYPDVFGPGTKLKYYPQFNGLKDDIVLERYTGKNSFEFLLNTYGCDAMLADGGVLQIVDPDSGDVVQTFNPAFAYDAEGTEYSQDEHYTDDCSYALEELSPHQYKLTLTVSETFLTDSATVYPVTIDPVTGNISNSMDTPIHSKRTTAGASGDANCVGDSTNLGHSRSLIKFNLPSEIRAGATINSAHFWTRELTARTTTMYCGAHMVTSAWNNNTLWSNQPTFNAMAMDRKNINSKSTDGGPNVYWYKFDIRGAVEGWMIGYANNGIILKSESEGSATYYQRLFAQLEYATSGYRPYTVINYTNDTDAPTISGISGNPAEWTCGDVTLTVNGAADGAGLHAQPYSFSSTQGQYNWQSSASKTFSSNQTVYVYTRDSLGNIALRGTVVINRIDKTAPTISDVQTLPSTWSNENGSVTVTATDSQSGITGYSFDGGATWQNSNRKDYTANTSNIVIKVMDVVGNIAHGPTVSIGCIDKDNPVITAVTGNPADWTNQDVTLTVTASDTSGIAAYSFDNGVTWQTENTKTYSENTNGIVVKVKDLAGNVTAISEPIDITKIDKQGPVKSPVIYEYNGLIYLHTPELLYPDEAPDTVSMQYKIGENGNWTNYVDSAGIEITRNQNITVYARGFDLAGNSSEICSKEFKTAYAVYSELASDGELRTVSYALALERTYRSDETGWDFAVDSHIENPYSMLGQENVITAILPNGERVVFLCELFSPGNSVYHSRDGKYHLVFYFTGYLHGYELTYEDQTMLTYDLEGKLVSIRDKNMNHIYISRSSTQITVSSASFGKTYTYNLNASGKPASLTDPMNNVTQYSYDTNWNLTTVTDPSGVIVGEYEYNNNNKMVKSQKATIEYSSNGGILSVSQQNGSKVNYSFNTTENSVESVSTDTKGNESRFTFDNQLRIVSQVNWDSTTTNTYDSNGNIISTTTDGQTTAFAYNGGDKLTCITYPDGTTQEYLYYDGVPTAYYNSGDLIREKDTEGNYTYYNYSTHNNITAVAKLKPLEGGALPPDSYLPTSDQSLFEVTNNTYQNNGLLSQSNDLENSVSISYTYDSAGNMVQQATTKPAAEGEIGTLQSNSGTITETVTYTYDGMGRVLTETKEGKTASTVYDAAGRTLRVTEDGKVTRSLYDDRGRLIQQIGPDQYDAADDGLNAETPVNTYGNPNIGHRYVYAENGNLTAETNANGLVTNYTYDQFGNLTTQAFDAYTFNYLASGNVSAAKVGDQTMVSYDYSADAKKLLNKASYANGQSIEYTYVGDKVRGIKLNGDTGFRFEYAYDETGELTQKLDHIANLKYVFTADDVKVYDISGETETLSRSYTLNSDLFTESVNNANYTSEFLENRDKFTLTEVLSVNKAYTRDSDDRLTSARVYQLAGETEAPSFTTDYTYDTENQTTGISHALNGTAITLSYTYDASGNIASVTQNSTATAYQYDSSQQLIRVDDGQQNRTFTYAYDARGNLVSKSEYAYTTGDLAGATPIDTISYTYGNSAWTDQLTAYDCSPITYDANGNRTSYDGWDYVWEAGRQLKQLSNGTSTYSYTYDDSGIRQTKTVDGTVTRYGTIDGKITSQTDGTNALYFRYDSNDELFGMSLNGTEYLYVRNLQGDVIAVTDLSGAVVAQYAYDAWGKVVSVTGTLADTVGRLNPMRYRGYYYDTETGFYYLQSRYYDPQIGRFINADDPTILMMMKDYAAGMNLFAYCNNNPINKSDPTGLWSIRLTNLQGTYRGRRNCMEGIGNLILVASLVFFSAWGFAFTLLKIAVAGTVFSYGLSSYITIPMGIIGYVSAIAAVSYGAWMISQIINAISYTNRYNRYTIQKVWRYSQFTYLVVR